jgi:hypothetical protein
MRLLRAFISFLANFVACATINKLYAASG